MGGVSGGRGVRDWLGAPRIGGAYREGVGEEANADQGVARLRALLAEPRLDRAHASCRTVGVKWQHAGVDSRAEGRHRYA